MGMGGERHAPLYRRLQGWSGRLKYHNVSINLYLQWSCLRVSVIWLSSEPPKIITVHTHYKFHVQVRICILFVHTSAKLRNVGAHVTDYTVSQPTKPQCEATLAFIVSTSHTTDRPLWKVTLRYEPEGRGLDSRSVVAIFLDLILPAPLWPSGRLSL